MCNGTLTPLLDFPVVTARARRAAPARTTPTGVGTENGVEDRVAMKFIVCDYSARIAMLVLISQQTPSEALFKYAGQEITTLPEALAFSTGHLRLKDVPEGFELSLSI